MTPRSAAGLPGAPKPDCGATMAGVFCYVEGTAIRTVRGDVPVERLRIGDEVVTAGGAVRLIRWIGRREVEVASHRLPDRVRPVRFRAGAMAPGLPYRDLLVSPDHAVVVAGALVKARRLVNGAGVVHDPLARPTYWHVELDAHDILLAEGLPAESYLDCANRSAFEKAGAAPDLNPDFDGGDLYALRACLRLVDEGPELVAARAATIAASSLHFTTDPALVLMADGAPLEPFAEQGEHRVYDVPPHTRALRLRSRSAIALEALADGRDGRRFGVIIRNLQIDGERVVVDDLTEGWLEQPPGRNSRWTDGDAALPLGRRVEFAWRGLERYPADA